MLCKAIAGVLIALFLYAFIQLEIHYLRGVATTELCKFNVTGLTGSAPRSEADLATCESAEAKRLLKSLDTHTLYMFQTFKGINKDWDPVRSATRPLDAP